MWQRRMTRNKPETEIICIGLDATLAWLLLLSCPYLSLLLPLYIPLSLSLFLFLLLLPLFLLLSLSAAAVDEKSISCCV